MWERIIVAAFAAALLAGCSGTESATVPPKLLRSADLRLPLDDYLLSPGELRDLGAARVVLIRQCMNAAGLDYPSRPDSPAAGSRTWNERRYGLTDPKLAAVHGYGLGDRDPAAQRSAPKPELDAAHRAALNGPQGCAAWAGREQQRDSGPGVDHDLPRRLATESFARSRREPTVVTAVREWSECMRATGLTYDDPLAPLSDPRFAGPRPPTPAELAAATTDVDCKERTNLIGVWFTAESAVQHDLVAANHAELQQVRQANEAQLALSRRLTNP